MNESEHYSEADTFKLYKDNPELSGNLEEDLERDFPGDDEEKLHVVTASLDRMRTELENMENMDATNFDEDQISKMENLREAIPAYEKVQHQLEQPAQDLGDVA
ncbi:MAG TPA: hypothetical protein VHQ41_02875 [Patescibacteria group bacterium]|jgi:hypothetical protein|nr:hypothetical protein [Patescibacteria group bacterium]